MRKSISHERTFAEISDRYVLVAKCKSLCEALAEDLKAEECKVCVDWVWVCARKGVALSFSSSIARCARVSSCVSLNSLCAHEHQPRAHVRRD